MESTYPDVEDDPPDSNRHDLRWRRTAWAMQPLFQEAATELGNFRTCRLPKCRRAKRCVGCHPPEEIGTTHFRKFPPCVRTTPAQNNLMLQVERMGERERQECLAAGHTPEELDRWEEEAEAREEALCDDDSLWPAALGGTART